MATQQRASELSEDCRHVFIDPDEWDWILDPFPEGRERDLMSLFRGACNMPIDLSHPNHEWITPAVANSANRILLANDRPFQISHIEGLRWSKQEIRLVRILT